MKLKNPFMLIVAAVLLASCTKNPDPAVDTLYLHGKDREKERREAIVTLYEHYANSKRDKEVYEVISKRYGRFIINYVPASKLLTLCGDPGSGWSNQVKNVDEATLQKLIMYKITFDDVNEIGTIDNKMDTLLQISRPVVDVKTNGSPSL